MSTLATKSKQWLQVGIICGLGATLTYFLSILVPLPGLKPSYLLFMGFGPLFSCAIYSFTQYLRVELDSIPLSLGTLLLVLAGAINTVMAAMQGAVRIYFDGLPHDKDVVGDAAYTAWKMGLHSGNALQMGVDVAWDYFVLIGVILWGFALGSHQSFGRWYAWPAVAIGAAGMVFNLWTFPDPPGNEGLVDVGPLVGAWFTVIVVRMIVLWRRPPVTTEG